MFLLAAKNVGVAAADEVEKRTATINGREFSWSAEYDLEVVAAKPLTERPITIDYDERGRLYVAESSGSNENVQEQLRKKPHSILQLTDSNGDGRYDTRTVFADKMMFPEGTLWYDGSLFVCAPPHIWRLTDTDDDGVADQREIWFDGKTLTHCANDLHGPYLGPDGWIYWCKGAFAEQSWQRPDGSKITSLASHIFRRRPEGGPREHVMTGGMDNPVDVEFSRGGERFFTTTFLVNPRNGQRDGIIHAIYGGVYGKRHRVINDHPRTGELMPPLIHLGAAAPSGMARSRANEHAETADVLLACEFNKHQVSRHRLSRRGGSFAAESDVLLSSPDLDFHPTDVIEDADGSILIVDTGGWYKLCCPTSQLYKPDIPGAIYRLRKPVKPIPAQRKLGVTEIEWATATPEQLANLVFHTNHAVREAAKRQLAKRRPVPVDLLRKNLERDEAFQRRHTVWALCRIADPSSREFNRIALKDADQEVRSAAAHAAAVWKDADAVNSLHELLNGSLVDQRIAAEALGRIGQRDSIPHLLRAVRGVEDRAVEHSLIYALMEIGDTKSMRDAVDPAHADEFRAVQLALAALGEKLDAAGIVELLDKKPAAPRAEATAWMLIEKHPEWSRLLLPWFERRLRQPGEHSNTSAFRLRLMKFAADKPMQELLAHLASEVPEKSANDIYSGMAGAAIQKFPASWSAVLESLLTSNNPSDQNTAIRIAHAQARIGLTKPLIVKLEKVAAAESSNARRLQTLAAISIARRKEPHSALPLDLATAEFVCDSLSMETPSELRGYAISILSNANTSTSRGPIIAAVQKTGPAELQQLLPIACGGATNADIDSIFAALEKSPFAATLDAEFLAKQLKKLGDTAQPKIATFFQRKEAERVTRLARLDNVLKKMPTADERRGQRVFHSTKTSCIVCHQMGYLGGNIGPSLRNIGGIRSDRDLLESILFPSASFVRSYEPVTILTADGRSWNGLIRNETGSQITLALNAEQTRQIKRSDIEQVFPSRVSIMPSGLGKLLTDQQLADLVQFLKVSK